MKIFSHESPEYTNTKPNGALEYSKEIVKYFIPNIKTDRNWVTINLAGYCYDHSIVFIHNNLTTELYEWLKDFDDLILVCSQTETMEKVKEYGHPIYLPLSVDVKEVEKYKTAKTGDNIILIKVNIFGSVKISFLSIFLPIFIPQY